MREGKIREQERGTEIERKKRRRRRRF
jgi:hypothetical protein